MNEKPLVLYIGRFGLPDNAASIRVFNNIKILEKIGYRVMCICLKENFQKEIKFSDTLFYHFLSSPNSNSTINTLTNFLDLIFAYKSFNVIKQLIKTTKPKTIILYNDLYALSYKLNKIKKLYNFNLIADVTEWYEVRKNPANWGERVMPYLTDKRIRYIDPKIKHIIAISPFLVDYYRSLNCNVLFLPPVFTLSPSVQINKHTNTKQSNINFLYAGSPGSKDIIVPFIEALQIINKVRIIIRFDIVGITAENLRALYNYTNFASIGIYAHGRVPHSEIQTFLTKSDFGLLLRHPRRYAKAGFSTKFAECMSNGVAMFCNKVGGAEEILTNGVDGIVIEHSDVKSIVEALQNIINLSEDEILAIRQNAMNKAVQLFSYENYVDKMKSFLQDQIYEEKDSIFC